MSAALGPGPDALSLEALLRRTTGISPEQLAAARARAEESDRRLLDVLLEERMVDPERALAAIAEDVGLAVRPAIDVAACDPTLVDRVPIGFAKQHAILPLGRGPDGTVRVAVADPFEADSLDDLRLLFEGVEVAAELAPRRAILDAINQVYDRGPASAEALALDASEDLYAIADEISHEPQDLLDSADDAPIIRLVNSLLQHAVKERASDVHLEPFEREIRVRFRIDDILYEPVRPLPRSLQAPIVSRIKIMGGLNIAEKRLPQDGRIRLKIAGRDYDVRLSTLPVAHGERVVMRLLPRTSEMLNLEALGFDEDHLAAWQKLITRPNGIMLVTGPTGSGKTTTLYGALSRINTLDVNIITVEDPVEIQLPGIGQIEVNAKIGLSFASGLRSILRQDPDVVLVGEIRDLETAEIAIQASLTGHLVFSTLHTNDAPSAITRLVDMGVERFLVASSLVAVLAQRLVRVLCTACREPYEPTPEELAELGVRPPPRPITVYRPQSCERCNFTGYRGRLGIFELMLIDDPIRELIAQNVDAKRIKRQAVASGMRTLRVDGARKVLRGITSIAEVLRATEEETVVAEV
ncbi:MAG: type II secretion system ATPase GspE [Deltaproteobacteria bacterium]|nr:type II secretion system ATPase GspE [Deltaproteobacteria bacterium]